MATCLVSGSIETTISVSVLNVPSPGRWSVPMSRTLRRSLPSQGGRVGAGVPVPAVPSGLGSTSSDGDGSRLAPAGSVSIGSIVSPGVGDASAVSQLGSASSVNTHWTRSRASAL